MLYLCSRRRLDPHRTLWRRPGSFLSFQVRSAFYLHTKGITHSTIQIPSLSYFFSLSLKLLISVDLLYTTGGRTWGDFCFAFAVIYFKILKRAQRITLQISFYFIKFTFSKICLKILQKNAKYQTLRKWE